MLVSNLSPILGASETASPFNMHLCLIPQGIPKFHVWSRVLELSADRNEIRWTADTITYFENILLVSRISDGSISAVIARAGLNRCFACYDPGKSASVVFPSCPFVPICHLTTIAGSTVSWGEAGNLTTRRIRRHGVMRGLSYIPVDSNVSQFFMYE